MSNPPSRLEPGRAAGSRPALEPVDCDLSGYADAVEIYESNIEHGAAVAGVYFSSSRQCATHGCILKWASGELVRTSPRDTPEILETVYSQLEDPLSDAETANRAVTANRELDFIERFTPPTAGLLDVGCSTGIFIGAARDRGWIVDGIKASTWAVRIARERFGLDQNRHGFVVGIEFPPASFDVMTLWDVLEHVHSPVGVLDRLHISLKRGGFLFVNVPNVESAMAAVLGHRWPFLLREHLWYFSPRTLDMALSKTKFRVRGTEPNRLTFSFAKVFLRPKRYGGRAAPVRRRLARSRASRTLRVSFPVGGITVVARREPWCVGTLLALERQRMYRGESYGRA